MDDQIGIAADRRSEMGVARRRQTEVADVFRLIDGLFHRAQEHAVDHPLFRFAAGGFQQSLELQRRQVFFILGQTVAQAQEKRLQRFQCVFIRSGMDTIERREIFSRELPRDGFVGGDHEFFDDPMGDIALGADDVFRQPLQIENDLGLRQIEVEIAARFAVGVNRQRQLFHQFECRRLDPR